MARQSVPFGQWLVVTNGSFADYHFTMGQDLLTCKSEDNDVHPLLQNITFALPYVRGEVVCFIEDDWYAPDYLLRMQEEVESGNELVGVVPAMYYNLASQRYLLLNNRQHSCLSATACSRSFLPVIAELCKTKDTPYLDYLLLGKGKLIQNWHTSSWREYDEVRVPHGRACKVGIGGVSPCEFPPYYIRRRKPNQTLYHVGIKGLGLGGIGIGHKLNVGRQDMDGNVLRLWLGEDAEVYKAPNES